MNIVEFVFDVGGPGDVLIINGNVHIISGNWARLPEFKSIIEKTLGNKTAWYSWVGFSKILFVDVLLLIFPEVCNLNNWITTAKLGGFLVFTSKLFIISRLDISSMVLIEVI